MENMLWKPQTLWLMCGIPGSGKSHWVQEKLATNSGVWCSRDLIRFNLLGENEDYFAHEDEVFDTWIVQIKKAIREGNENIYVDATHLTEKARNKVLDRLNLKNVEVVPVAFRTPLEKCIELNARRTGLANVPESAIRNMYKTYKIPTMYEKYKYAAIIFPEVPNV